MLLSTTSAMHYSVIFVVVWFVDLGFSNGFLYISSIFNLEMPSTRVLLQPLL